MTNLGSVLKSKDITLPKKVHLVKAIGEGNGNPLQYSCLENPRDSGAYWAAVCGVAQSWTRLMRLSSSSSSSQSYERYGFPVVMYGCESCTMLTKKDVQLESCELSFIWGKMRTAAQEAAISDSSERLLQSGSGGKSIYKVLVKGEFNTMKH